MTKLRRSLGTETKLLSTDRLGQLVNVPGATLRSVETGRRPFSAQLRRQLRVRGLEWDEHSQRWFFTYDHKTPISLFLLESVHRLTRGDSHSQQDDLKCLCQRVTALMEHVPDSAYADLFFDLQSSLERLRDRYQVQGVEQVFRHTAVKLKMEKTPSGSQHLVKSRSGPMGRVDLSELEPPQTKESEPSRKPAA